MIEISNIQSSILLHFFNDLILSVGALMYLVLGVVGMAGFMGYLAGCFIARILHFCPSLRTEGIITENNYTNGTSEDRKLGNGYGTSFELVISP